jgi:NADPH-dependent 2,4-dienoyl-CoA reductase/sulfur reductase-like enzyme
VKRAAAIGGGFIGMEVAAVLALKGVDLTMILSDDRIWKLFFKPQIASSARSILATNATPLEVTVTV